MHTKTVESKRSGRSDPILTQLSAPSLGPGRPLDGATASRMSHALGHSFATVRIHDDDQGAALAASMSSAAATVGDDVALARDAPRPGTLMGDALLAHELAHVIQQDGASPLVRGDSDRALESEANHAAATVIMGGTASGRSRVSGRTGGLQLQRCDYTPEQLRAYRSGLDQRGTIAGGFYGDDKARQVVRDWAHRTNEVPGTELTPRRKVLLIRELMDGDFSGSDQEMVLELLERSSDTELTLMFSVESGLTVAQIAAGMSGDRKLRFDNWVDARLDEGGKFKDGKVVPSGREATDVGQALPDVSGKRAPSTRTTRGPSSPDIDAWIKADYGADILSESNAPGTLGRSFDLWSKHTTLELSNVGPVEVARPDFLSKCTELLTGPSEEDMTRKERAKRNQEKMDECEKNWIVSRGLYVRHDAKNPAGRSLIKGDAPARTYVHEALHAYTHSSGRQQLGKDLEEGMTEYFARQVALRHDLSLLSPSYEKERIVIEEMVVAIGTDKPIRRAYFGGNVEALRTAYDAVRGKGAFERLVKASVEDAYKQVTGGAQKP